MGGGLVAGDQIDIDVRVGPRARCVITTQSSTKVYKNPANAQCGQRLRATVCEDALLVLAPDPVTCFAGASYKQQQRIELERGGSLVVVDWLTSGRRARGECWSFSGFRSRLDVFLGPEHLLADSLCLDPNDGPIEAPHRLGRFHCLATVVVIGELLCEAIERLLEQIARQPIRRNAPLINSASRIRHGAILRILGTTTEQVACYQREKLCFLANLLGDTPWARKW
jgi:urease accessory protein